MSTRVIIDYDSISMKTVTICVNTLESIQSLEEKLEIFKKRNATLLDARSLNLIKDMTNQLHEAAQNVENLQKKARQKRGKESVATESERHAANQPLRDATTISRYIDKMQTETYYTIQERVMQRLKDNASGVFKEKALTEQQLKLINDEKDIVLKDALYDIWSLDPSLTQETAYQKAQEKTAVDTAESIKKNDVVIREEIMNEMKQKKVSDDVIEDIALKKQSIKDLRKSASKEIVDEGVRRETIKIIVKTIKSQGFIVSSKNIKFRKDQNDVYVLAQKASGEYAEFNVFLDGRFIYKFDGYEGQACQEDIKPFMDTLKEIYDIDVKKEEVTWSNPDKYQTRKYQTMKQGRNKN